MFYEVACLASQIKTLFTHCRTALMKRWSSAKYYREHEGRPVDQGGRVKGCFVKKQGSVDNSK
jgi:hypothetical protein